MRVRTAALLSSLALLAATGDCVFREDPVNGFDLGVAAFEVTPEGAILWTHVEPTDPGLSLRLTAQVSDDPAFANVLGEWPAFTGASLDYTVQREVSGLAPSTAHWFRFRAAAPDGDGTLLSPVGRFVTAPRPDDRVPVRFVISGDANAGYARREGFDFHVLSAAAAQEPDFFVFFGDTIYSDSGVLPSGADAITLDEYREVHRITRSDPHLTALLGVTGTFTGWDDHEVQNDYAGESVDPERFANGARAFFEYLPIRPHERRGDFRTHRRVRWGRDLEMFFIDGRQFRSAEEFCNETLPDGPETPETLFSPFTRDEEILGTLLGNDPALFQQVAELVLLPSDPDCVDELLADPGRTFLGAEQLAWLQAALLDSDATFKVIINDVPISDIFFQPYDRWEGYLAERQLLLDFIAANLDPDRTLVLTTDFHTNLGLRRPELTELLVGPIGQSTFGSGLVSLLPPELADQADSLFLLLNVALGLGNGALLGSEPDAFSFAEIEVFEETGEARLRATVWGDPDYAAGRNDPGDVVELFSFEMPPR
jgi:phosphodiesterase/alkaline phosphatase D-like protein